MNTSGKRTKLPKSYTHIHNLNGWTMNKVICLDSHGDWLHVIERVPDADLSETLLDLKDDYYGFLVFPIRG